MPPRSRSKSIDRFHHERMLWREGQRHIAGVDEAGRGPLAGPVVAAAVILPSHWGDEGIPPELEGLNDSKQISEKQRELFFEAIVSNERIVWCVAECSSKEIDTINILQATHRAMNRALAGLPVCPDHALMDGRPVKTLGFEHTALVKGDSLSYSIAAASILAKVSRDRKMLEYDATFPEYGFAEHKGYGTAQHLDAIRNFGPCPIHRLTFAPLKPVQKELF